jgi:hypothetical protein
VKDDFIKKERATTPDRTAEKSEGIGGGTPQLAAGPAEKSKAATGGKDREAASPEGSGLASLAGSGFTRRAYQEVGLELAILHRSFIWFWSRQDGKTTTASDLTLYEMMKFKGRTVVFATATLLLGREVILKDATTMQDSLVRMHQAAEQNRMKLQVQDHDRPGKDLSGKLTSDDFAELFEAKRLEFWLYHDRNTFSRTIVIAPNVATARGWTGTVFMDEIGHIADLKDLMTAIKPIMQTNPRFRLGMSGTPPEDDTHFSFELFSPPIGAEPAQANPKGHIYENEYGIPVHRVDLFDAMAAGKRIFHPVSGEEISAQEDRRIDADRDGWDRNHSLVLKAGGTAACGLLQLDTAQRRGVGECALVQVDSDLDFDTALAFLRSHLGKGSVGIGVDIATTTKETSNPTSVTVTESHGVDRIQRLVVLWKTKDPALATERIRRIVECVAQRAPDSESGRSERRARRLAIDATSERYFAESLKSALGNLLPVELVIQSESIEVPGNEGPIPIKTHLGDLYVAELDDNHLTLPPERYFKEDHRMVRKDRGAYVADPQPDGKHADTFDSGKLANWALSSTSGAIESVAGIKMGGVRAGRATDGRLFIPRRLRPGVMI